MPNISSLTMPDGIVYAIKDSQARKDIEDIKKNSSGSEGSGGSGGGYDPYVVEIEGMGTQSMTTDAVFADAKTQFLANKPVLFRFSYAGAGTYVLQAVAHSDAGEKEMLTANMEEGVAIVFASDGSISISNH